MESIIEYYNKHHHLRIRLDDAWPAVLTQLSMHINRNAEQLRGKFVAHERKKELCITYSETRFTLDFGDIAKSMAQLLQDNVVDADLRDWLVLSFSTTTKDDKVVASIIIMAFLQQYFSYKVYIWRGLPSVTLLEEKEDWEQIFRKLIVDYLPGRTNFILSTAKTCDGPVHPHL